MDENNIGFRQYKLPIETDVALNKTVINVGNGFIVDGEHPLSNIVDGRIDTYCQLQGNTQKRIRIVLASSQEEPVYCNRMVLVFNKKMSHVLIRDGYNNKILETKNYSKGFFKIEQDINKEFRYINIRFRTFEDDEIIKVSNIEIYNNTLINSIEPPEGYYIKDFEIQSEKVKGGEDNGDN